MRPGVLVVAGVTVALSACGASAPAVDIAAETEALRAAAAAYDAAVEALDGAAMAGFYADDSRAMPPGESTLAGASAMQMFVEEMAGIEGFSAVLADPEVTVGAGGDLGYTVADLQVTMPGPDGELSTTDERDVHIWRKQADGTWKIVVDIWNSTTPLPPAGG